MVAIASSKDVVFQGGPQPWVLDSSKFFHTCMSVVSRCVSYCCGFVLTKKKVVTAECQNIFCLLLLHLL